MQYQRISRIYTNTLTFLCIVFPRSHINMLTHSLLLTFVSLPTQEHGIGTQLVAKAQFREGAQLPDTASELGVAPPRSSSAASTSTFRRPLSVVLHFFSL